MDLSVYHRFYEVEERHWWFVGRRAIVKALLDDMTDSPAAGPRRLLDVGCGTGGMMPLLSEYGAVTGIDSEPVALDYCRKRGFTDLHLLSEFRAEEPYDVVALFDVLEHVADEAGFLAWTRGLVRPGGRIILTVPANPWLWSRHDDLNHHQRRYTRKTVVAALEAAGFHVERATHFNFWLFPVAILARRFAARKARPGIDPARDAEEILKPFRIGPWNGFLASVFAGEAALVRSMSLPWGLSVAVVASPRHGA